MNTYGSTIKQIRKSKGLMLKELADDHLSVSLLSQFENNKTTISCEIFHLLLEKLEVSYEEFFLTHYGKNVQKRSSESLIMFNICIWR